MNEIETSIHQSPNVVFKETISHYKAFNNELTLDCIVNCLHAIMA